MAKIILTFTILFSALSLCAQSRNTCPDCNGDGEKIERCSDCHNGAVYCKTCDYRGTIDSNCSSCNGQGYTLETVKKTCSSCQGARYTRMQKSTPCSCRGGKRPQTTRGGNVVYIDCSRCNGTGQLISYYNAACRYCAGSGYSGTETKQNTCYNCNGAGVKKETCYTCNGKGAYVCSVCHGYANIKKPCKRCSGYGFIYTN